ncbi:MAG: DNA-directed RNA polymerase subunit L [Thermoprotei archaeon]|nr:MAG: DNA-directed RNA polymerase subunit L [Thermoprotei archaeon]RLE96652.1 MAG: DNA-directed RNA polymerase subunit L [Thermoprotei archaeon]
MEEVGESLEVEVERLEPTRLTIRVRGEDHTIFNVLVEELNRDEHVVFAAYKQLHPLTGEYTLTVVTDGEEEPLAALRSACERLKEVYGSLLNQLSRG